METSARARVEPAAATQGCAPAFERRAFLRSGAAALACTQGLRSASAQAWPAGPVTVVLPLQVGSASDIAVRTTTERLSKRLGVSFLVENAVGGAGMVGLERIARSAPDGQTLAALNNSIMTILPHLKPGRLKLDPLKDFAPIIGIANIPTFLGVRKDSPIRSVKDLVAAAKQDPGKLMYSSGGVGSPQHLSTEMLMSFADIKLLHVPYKGASQAALAVASGEVDLMMIALSLAQPYLPDARVRLIGYGGLERHPQFRDIPTLAEEGVSGYEYASWIGLFAPTRTPQAVLETLRTTAGQIVGDEGLQQTLVRGGLDPWPKSPVELDRIVHADHARWGKIIESAQIPKG